MISDIKKDINDSLNKEVTDEIKGIIVKQAEREVLDTYTPTAYERRRVGGVDDPDSYFSDVKDMTLSIDDQLLFNTDYDTKNVGVGLSELINDGDGAGGHYYDYDGEFEEARPYFDKAAEIVENTDKVEDALAKGLMRNGNSIK